MIDLDYEVAKLITNWIGERANTAWCVLKSHRLLAGESPVPVSVRTPDSRQPMQSGD